MTAAEFIRRMHSAGFPTVHASWSALSGWFTAANDPRSNSTVETGGHDDLEAALVRLLELAEATG